MAVALSLLIVLPGLAQTSDITDGRGGSGNISVGVFDDIEDAQLAKLTVSNFSPWPDPPGAPVPLPYIPIAADATPANLGGAADVHTGTDRAYLADLRVDPQDTFFRNTLYVSNDGSAYNTVVVNVNTSGLTAYDNTCVQVDGASGPDAVVTAVVRNNRSGDTITMELVRAGDGDSTNSLAPDGTLDADAGDYAQALFKVVEQGATGTYDPTPGDTTNNDERELEFRQHGGPTWCDTAATRDYDPTPDDPSSGDEVTGIEVEETATSAAYGPIPLPGVAGEPLLGVAPPEQQEIATIFARHGDRLTITVPGQSGSVELTVDGAGPDFTAITPEDNDVTRSSRLTYSFEVRDDDSGLRHDGEARLTEDDDYEEVNPDGDQHLETEPLSEDPNAAVSANGPAADIDVNVVVNPRSTDPNPAAVTYEDISASGTWRIAGSRAGVAYSFTASGADKTDNHYLYQLRARDRAGNWSVTDADDDRDAPGNQPFVFRVDNVDPDLAVARTGISWNSEDDAEEADRSYIALDFGGDAIGDVDTDNITVVGHNIVGYIHPGTAPAINRNEGAPDRADYDPVRIRYSPAERTAPDATALAEARSPSGTPTPTSRTQAQNDILISQGRFTRYTATQVILDALTAEQDAVAPVMPTTTEPDDCTSLVIADVSSTDLETCGEWVEYRAEVALFNTGESDRVAATARFMADDAAFDKSLMPGTDIEGNDIVEPRSLVYIELADELASDETPTVQVVGGAVRDLAGNANDARTLGAAEVQDWIAPKLTVTVTGTAADRQVANVKGSFTVDVSADEDVTRPRVFFVALKATAATTMNSDGTSSLTGAYNYTIGPATDGTNEANSLTAQEAENHWSRAYKVNSADLSGFDDAKGQLVGVIVLAEDDEDNSGATAGWTPSMHREAPVPTAGNKLNLAKMDGAGLLVEIDRSVLDASEIFVTPRSDADGEETESANPFVKLDFTNEGSEYQVCELDANDECREGVKVEYRDSHSRVDIPEITVNGENALASLARIDSNEFSLVLRDLEVGEYEVWYAVTDDAGNEGEEVEGLFKFEVKPRQPYEIEVTPGWNLISLPATPLEPAIGNVLGNNPYISPVLAYQDGDWVTAIQEEDGTWRGRLEEIEGGYGYWVHARTFETIETMLSETDPASTLPTVPVTQGWNLLGVLDVYQNADGDAPGLHNDEQDGDPEADNYLKSIQWRVAYTYDTTASLWVKTVPDVGDDSEITNGTGYWVWSNSPGTLAP